jgi:hypothetical protein
VPVSSSPAATEDTSSTVFSPYEKESIDDALAHLGTRLDPRPQGKIVEAIDVVTLDVIEPRDPAPSALNLLHATTRRYVIEREVLQRAGEPYQPLLCDETARNLRQLPQLSLVLCLATTGKTPDQVRVLVVTKDVWSLRLGWDIAFTGGALESLQLVPTESNLAGSHEIALLRYIYQPQSQTLGASYQIPRLAGLRLALSSEVDVIWNRQGHAEGTAGSIGVSTPLYSSRTEWAWAVGSSWFDSILRRYINGQVANYNAVVTPERDAIPWQYHGRRFAEGAYAVRSFGWEIKHDITFGAEVNLRAYRPPSLPGVDPAAVNEFVVLQMPRSDTRVGPFVQYHGYTSDFLRVLDFETLGLQEDFRLGHDVYARVYPISRWAGSSRDFLGTYAAAEYTVGLGDGLLRGGVESTLEAEKERVSDAWIAANLRAVTPRLGVGRFVFDGVLLNRYRNYLNRSSLLGGDGRLRGYPSNYFFGKDLIAYNVEFRSRPIEILSCQLGGAAFYDAGHAANGLANLSLRHSVGFGFRVLFPQLDRLVFRGDVGFPLAASRDPGVAPAAISVAFEQAFSVPSVGGRLDDGPGAGWLGQ